MPGDRPKAGAPGRRRRRPPRAPLTRGKIMARVRGRDTGPEVAVRKALHAMGARFRLQARDLPGRPDVVNRSRRWAVFVHG